MSTSELKRHLRLHSLQVAGALVLGASSGCSSASDETREVTVPLEAIHTLATPEVVSRVVDVQPSGDGRVWVLNSVAPFFVVLAQDGQVERVFGERGEGPQEFGAPWALVRGAAPTDIWSYDVRKSALIQVAPGERRELTLPIDSIPPSSLISFKGAGINQAPPWLERTSNGFLMARARGSQLETALQTWSADILLIRDDGPEAGLELHTPVADLVGDPAVKYGDATTLLPYPVWTVCADGTVGLYDPLANTLRRFAADGDELGAFALPDERKLEITVDRVFEMFFRQLQQNVPSGRLPEKAEMRNLTREQNEDLVKKSAGVFPEYADLICAADGTLWIRPFDINAVRLGQGSDWIRFRADGSPTRIALPGGFRTFRIEADRIWGVLPGPLGVESIAWVELASLQ